MVLKKVKNGLTSGRKKRKLHSKILGKGWKTVFTGIFEFRRDKKKTPCEQTREYFWSRDSWNCYQNGFSRVLTKRVFLVCLRNECPRFFFSPYECLRNEFSRNEFSSLAHETSVHDTIFNSCITHPDINRLQKSAFMTSY